MKDRLFSLDVLRGMDMILLTVIGPLLWAMQRCWNCFPAGFMRQFEHGWVCFTLWDIIMPLFIFICGAAIPFALGRRLKEGPVCFWKHVFVRVAFLWCLGGLVQGRWITLDPLQVSPYSNTLQSIAAGYLIVAVVISLKSNVLEVVVPVVLALAYTMMLVFGGDYSQFGNFAFKVDHAILKATLPANSVWVTRPSHYTWFLTSAMCGAMSFAGYHATRILQSDRTKWRKAGMLFAYGAVLLAVGLLSEVWVPCIKPIFTLTFTAQAMGWCVIALAALYVLNDIWMFRAGFSGVLLFGQMALTAYFVSHFFAPVLRASAHLFGDGLIACLPKSSSDFVMTLLEIVCMIVVMFFWHEFRSRGNKQ